MQPEVEPDCLGTLCAESSAKGTELPASLESVFEQPAHLRVAVVCALGLGCLEPVGKRKGCISRSIERVLWNQYCMIVLSVVWGGRAVALLWRVIEHKSASVSTHEYMPLLRLARWLLRKFPNVMLLADRGECQSFTAGVVQAQWLALVHSSASVMFACTE